MRAVFTLTIFLSSALLFLVQPMVAKMILPSFGGSPAVWNTSMVFFQIVLLLGYAYAHFSFRYLGPRAQPVVHVVLLVLAALLLPIALPAAFRADPNTDPSLPLLLLLVGMVGLPFFVLSAGAPLLQRWFATNRDPQAKDPYFLYSASNLGSMISLLAYPTVVEPALRLAEQSRAWMFAFYGLIIVIGGCAVLTLRARPAEPAASDEAQTEEIDIPVTNPQRLLWLALSAIPSSLLLGSTTYLTSNIAPMPLLWVIPLAIYLLTFIIAFSGKSPVTAVGLGRFLSIIVTPLTFAMVLESTEPLGPLAIIHVLAFTLAAWMCHQRLADLRPSARHLTEFYLYLSAGGAIGGVFNALIAPNIFLTLAEYPLAIVLACVLRPPVLRSEKNGVWHRPNVDFVYPAVILGLTILSVVIARAAGMPASPSRTALTIGLPAVLAFLAVDRPIRFGLSIGAIFLASSIMNTSSDGTIINIKRSFFGVHRVVASGTRWHRLVHGNTLHGMQDLKNPSVPLTYYYPTGPIGQILDTLKDKSPRKNLAFVGLGVGSLAAYGQPGQTIDYFEIDPDVEDVARNPKLFTFLRDSKATVNVKLGDARLSLAREPQDHYGVIVLDAFSSDSIPVHLLTREAIELYRTKLAPGGILVFHISNRYLDLEPILAAAAKDLSMAAIIQSDTDLSDEESEKGKTRSVWVALARNESDLKVLRTTSAWSDVTSVEGRKAWTDDYSNLISAIEWSQIFGR